MTATELKKRTFEFALQTLKIVEKIDKTTANDVMGKQLIRAATSVGANYRSACRAKSNADFINKLKIIEEEADEVIYWLELIKEYNNIKTEIFNTHLSEAKQLDRIFVASTLTAKARAGRL